MPRAGELTNGVPRLPEIGPISTGCKRTCISGRNAAFKSGARRWDACLPTSLPFRPLRRTCAWISQLESTTPGMASLYISARRAVCQGGETKAPAGASSRFGSHGTRRGFGRNRCRLSFPIPSRFIPAISPPPSSSLGPFLASEISEVFPVDNASCSVGVNDVFTHTLHLRHTDPGMG